MAVLFKCTTAQLPSYFDRIELPENHRANLAPSLELLSAIQWHHVSHIPYENLSLVHPRAVGNGDSPLVAELNLDAVFEKLVVRRTRGGYCFEQNLLLAAVLRALGFKLYTSAARVVEWSALVPGSDVVPLKGLSHQVLIIQLDGQDYLVDGGFTPECPRRPLPLQHLATSPDACDPISEGGIYRLRRGVLWSTKVPEDPLRSDAGWYVQCASRHGGWKFLYFFPEVDFLQRDYNVLNVHCSTGKDSIFLKVTPRKLHLDKATTPREQYTWVEKASEAQTKGNVCSIQTLQGRATLENRRLHVFEGQNLMINEELKSTEEVDAVLKGRFGIVIP